jgi:class 3 adenylate cyclase/tetratricopeptide (TPR) repeat protein
VREQRKVVTVLFCDLVGSTALGEATDPEALRARMRGYFEDLRAIVERHGGTVEKFVGDAVMAVFGIPTAHEDDALRAVRAASEMRDAIAAHGLEARIGISTGEVVVGGEGETLVTGDTVNVAARLEQAAVPGETLIGAETRLLVRDAADVEPVEPLELKGKAQPVEAYRLMDVRAEASSPARHPETPLVGRERERERLWRDYEDAVAGSACRLFTLLGPAGIGKSRLVADFLERLDGSADVLRGRCLPYGEGITYWPLLEMLASLELDPVGIVASTPEETRVAFRRLLEARAVDRPQVVVIDDLQWAEPTFVDLVEHVADLSRGASIFLLCIARTELLELRPDWGGGKLNVTSLLLGPLDDDERAILIDALPGGTSLDEDVRDRIAAASAGYPLYVEEMLAMLREQGGGQVAVPPTIQALLQARIDALEIDVRVVLERGAIEGEVFHRRAVAELAPAEVAADVDGHLASLVRKELVWPERALTPGEEAYRFRHLLVREVVYGSMPKVLRAELHERFADWLGERAGDTAFELDEIAGYHLEQSVTLRAELGEAGPAERDLAARAAARLLAAGSGALGRADLHAAANLLQRGVDLLPAGDPARLEALVDLARVFQRRGELERTRAGLLATIEEARDARDQRSEDLARLALNSLITRVDPDSTVESRLSKAVEIAASFERSGDLAYLARAQADIGMCRFMIGHAGEGQADLRRAAELAREVGDRALEREVMNSRLRPIAWGPTPAEEGAAYSTMLVESDITSVAEKAHALQVRCMCAAFNGDVDEVRHSSSRARALIEEFGLTLQQAVYAMDVGFAYTLAGDLDEAERVLREGHDFLVGIGDVGSRCTVDGLLADVLVRQGRYEEAAAFAAESRAIAGVDDLDAQPRWRAALARVLSARGEHAEAEALAREAVALVEPIDLVVKATAYDALGEVLARAGKAEEAADVVERAISLHEQKGNVVSSARARALLGELRASRPS